MENKIVSFKVAKVIKEAGYPQNTRKVYALQSRGSIKEGEIIDCSWTTINTASIPTYLDVWLWLWREKNIRIREYITKIVIYNNDEIGYITQLLNTHNDPEEAIITAIEYLVDNNLIK